MDKGQKPDRKRGDVAFIFAIVLGLLLGLAIRRVRLGLILGLGLGLAIVFLGYMRSSNRHD